MKDMKVSGKVVLAQNNTTNRTNFFTEQQLHRHVTIYLYLEEPKRLNQPWEEFEAVINLFDGNTDKTCLMAANGKISVIVSGAKNKTEDISDDCR